MLRAPVTTLTTALREGLRYLPDNVQQIKALEISPQFPDIRTFIHSSIPLPSGHDQLALTVCLNSATKAMHILQSLLASSGAPWIPPLRLSISSKGTYTLVYELDTQTLDNNASEVHNALSAEDVYHHLAALFMALRLHGEGIPAQWKLAEHSYSVGYFTALNPTSASLLGGALFYPTTFKDLLTGKREPYTPLMLAFPDPTFLSSRQTLLSSLMETL